MMKHLEGMMDTIIHIKAQEDDSDFIDYFYELVQKMESMKKQLTNGAEALQDTINKLVNNRNEVHTEDLEDIEDIIDHAEKSASQVDNLLDELYHTRFLEG